jgi:hypothetical protein
MPYILQSDFVYDCAQCTTRCDGVSKGVYNFEHDVSFSEQYEQMVIDRINLSDKYKAVKCDVAGYPDIALMSNDGKVCKYVEIKVQRRTFMHVQQHLPASMLTPSETLALNLSDLLRYFEIEKETHVPTTILWFLLNRPCIVPSNSFLLFFQLSNELKKIYEACNDTRRFRRLSGEGDVVDGKHKGVTVNYHFSLKELKQWKWADII